MNTDKQLRTFAEFLTAGWETMKQLTSSLDPHNEPEADWIQANWEVLVESALLPNASGFLEVYGDGADCNDRSSRVYQPSARATHRVVCLPSTGEFLRDLGTGESVSIEEAVFWGFVRWEEGQYDPLPPFNAVLAETRNGVIVVDVETVVFVLQEIRGSSQANAEQRPVTAPPSTS